jgi:outer membrane protein assembly factor BamB
VPGAPEDDEARGDDGMRHAAFALFAVVVAAGPAAADDWPDWRGPSRDGRSAEKNLPSSWSPAGQNLAWKAPIGSRSGPVVFGNRLYLHAPAGDKETSQERLLCLDADTGKVLWELKFNLYHTDVPTHRVAWASPTVDPATGNVYVFGVADELRAVSPAGKLLWDRSLTEEFGAISTHGGRTVSPVIVDDLVIVSTLTAGWGDQGRGGNRYFGFDKKTGEVAWVNAPQPRHYDTNYSTPALAHVDGMALLVVGGSDGSILAMKPATGELVWRYEMSKRAILTSVVVDGTTVYTTHSEENLDRSEMGQIAALDATLKGEIKTAQAKWHHYGFQGGFSSPVIDGERLYQVDNGAVIGAFDLATGTKLWEKPLGTIQKASPVLADGKLYVGTENGKVYILKATAKGVEILDEDQLGTAAAPEAIVASPAVARGRLYVASMDALYAIGPKGARAAGAKTGSAPAPAPPVGAPAHVQVRPYESVLKPGETVKLRVRLYDAKGNFVREETGGTWTAEGLKGVTTNGVFNAGPEAVPQGGVVKVAVSGLTGQARVRVLPPLPWSFDFENSAGEAPPAFWVNSTGKYLVRDRAGNKAIQKLMEPLLFRRGRLFMGPVGAADYTVEADVMALEKRRQMGDAGLIAQRYALVLFGNSQNLELHPWQANPARTVAAPFSWKPDTWYRLKLRVQNQPGGTALVQAKAWLAAEPEPAAWTLEMKDTMPHRHGAAGLYADASNEVFFDNVKVVPNR